jgi:CRP-like cAMP-binding protein
VADAVFYIQEDKVRLTVVSKIGKEATLGIFNEGDFFGEGCLVGRSFRMKSATAMTDCELLRIDKKAMMQALHGNTSSQIYSWPICWHETFGTKRI